MLRRGETTTAAQSHRVIALSIDLTGIIAAMTHSKYN